VALGDLTSAEAVRAAIAEFDELGREAFLAKYGFGRSLRYFVEEGGKRYDSKAIAGVAYGYEHPDGRPLTNDLFSGGVPVQAKLEQLGFAVVVEGSSASPVLQSALSGLDETRLETRRTSEQEARELLDRSAGAMTESDFNQLFKLLNSDFYRGRSHLNRLSPAFIGQTGQNLLADLARLNSWTDRIWRGSEGEALEAVGELLANRGLLPGAGTSYPTILMYLRDPKKWPVWLPITDRGLRAVWTYDSPRKPGSGRLPDYEAFSASAREFIDEYEVAPELLDSVLAEAGRGHVAPTDAGQVWMFQANPRYYDIDRALRELPEIEWTVRQYRRRVKEGDRVYIWKSGAGGGVAAQGRVASPVYDSLPDPADDSYYREREAFSKSEPRVRIAIEQVVDPPNGREAVHGDPILGGLSILAFANATVHDVKPEEDERLREMIGGLTAPVRYFILQQRADNAYEWDEEGVVYHFTAGASGSWRKLSETSGARFVYYRGALRARAADSSRARARTRRGATTHPLDRRSRHGTWCKGSRSLPLVAEGFILARRRCEHGR
jgi:EVE domain